MRAPTNMGIAPWNQRGLTNLERDRIRAAWAVNQEIEELRARRAQLKKMSPVSINRGRT